ncbi:T9SS type A sorting domain-containing protein [Maribacter sp. 2307ULW6-5]|uniref:T9SS type A sorting domain-containing protein n=1 Tax=Maribacter sp. 2307ULW6-5 TaxID=3386275 RepID=UPI0039BD7D5D
MKTIYLLLCIGMTLSATAQETRTAVSPQEKHIEGFKLYPNPATDQVVYVSTALNEIKTVHIYDVFGELVLTDNIRGKTLNIGRLVPGVYMVRVTENGKHMHRKLVVR